MTTYNNKGINNLPVFEVEQEKQRKVKTSRNQENSSTKKATVSQPPKQKRAWVRRTPEEKRALYLAKHPGKPGGNRNPWGCKGRPQENAVPRPATPTPSSASTQSSSDSVPPQTQPVSVAIHGPAHLDVSPIPRFALAGSPAAVLRLPRQVADEEEREDEVADVSAPAVSVDNTADFDSIPQPAVIDAPSTTEVEPMCPPLEPEYTQVYFGGLSFLLPSS